MISSFDLRHRRHILVAAGFTLALAGSTSAALADDAVSHFFSTVFGGEAEAPAAVPQHSTLQAEPGRPARVRHVRVAAWHPAVLARPLVVRLHRPATAIAVTQRPARPERISILDDPTLRSGDMVMTAEGLRVFQGAASPNHTRGDFTALATAKALDPAVARQVSPLDRLPRI